jgi:hypothetical protein
VDASDEVVEFLVGEDADSGGPERLHRVLPDFLAFCAGRLGLVRWVVGGGLVSVLLIVMSGLLNRRCETPSSPEAR